MISTKSSSSELSHNWNISIKTRSTKIKLLISFYSRLSLLAFGFPLYFIQLVTVYPICDTSHYFQLNKLEQPKILEITTQYHNPLTLQHWANVLSHLFSTFFWTFKRVFNFFKIYKEPKNKNSAIPIRNNRKKINLSLISFTHLCALFVLLSCYDFRHNICYLFEWIHFFKFKFQSFLVFSSIY